MASKVMNENKTSLTDLILSSRNKDLCTIEATVDTGFESLAEQECLNKFGPELMICRCRGRVYFNVSVAQYSLVCTLRSVNNLFLVVEFFTDVDFQIKEENKEEEDLEIIRNLSEKITWETYLNMWKTIVNFNGMLYPSKEDYLESNSRFKRNGGMSIHSSASERIFSHLSNELDTVLDTILHFRVTCYRSGQHSFDSQNAARHFGGRLQDRFNWIVDLDGYQLEIVLAIKNRDVKITFTITEFSMHKRNLSHFGITTLRSTISYNLLQVVKPEVGDLILDPLCGSGSIPIEGASGIPGNFYLCGDIDKNSIELTSLNKLTYFQNRSKDLLIDPFLWNVCALPLRNSCIDVVATDLPFGKRVGSKYNNRTLYSNAMKELARVVKLGTGRVVLLTADRTSYNLSLQRNQMYWKQMKMLVVKLGGLKACVYMLHRTRQVFIK